MTRTPKTTIKKRPYDEEEIALIEQIPDNYVGNLSKGFRELAKQLDRTPAAISFKYYQLRRENRSKVSFVLISKNKAIANTKTVTSKSPVSPINVATSTFLRLLSKLRFWKKRK